MSLLRNLPLALCLLGYAVLAVIGTRTAMVFQWPSYMLFGAAAVASLLLLGRRMKVTPGTLCLASTLMLTAYVVVRAAVSPVSYFGRMEIAMVLAAAIIYLLFSIYIVRARYRLAFVSLLLLLVLGNVLVGLYQILRDPSYMVLPGYSRGTMPGAGGFYRNYNHLGGFLLIGFSFAIALGLFGKIGSKTRVCVLFLVPVALGGIAMTTSRGTFISLAFAVLVLLLICLYLALRFYEYEFKKIAIVVLPIIAVIGLLFVVLSVKALSQRRGIEITEGDGIENFTRDSEVRFVNWSLAYDQWKEYPFFGQGARMYDVYSVEHWPASRAKVFGDAEFAHNDYLQMLGEYGMVGFALVLFFIAAHVFAGVRFLIYFRDHEFADRRARTDSSLALCLGALVVLAAYAVHSVFDFNLHLPANLLPVAFAFAILANPSARRAPWRRASPAWLVGGARFVLPLAGAFLLWSGVRFSRGEWHLERARWIPIGEDYSEVIARTHESLKYDEGNFYTYRLHGTALMLFGFDFEFKELSSGFMSRAIESFEKGLAINPYDIFTLVGMGRCLDALGEPERAEEFYVKATEIGVRSREAHRRYAEHHLNRGLDLVVDNLVEGMRRLELAETEMHKAWQANELITREDLEYQELEKIRRYLSHAYEEHGNRLANAAASLREKGDAASERAYLESALDYYSRARLGAPDRRPGLNQYRRDIMERLKELGEGL